MAIPNDVHDPDLWVELLKPLLLELDFAFQIAVPKAHQFFTNYHKKPVNRPLLSNLIRYHALEYLWSSGHSDAKEEDEDGWGFRGLPNNGIELLYQQSCIRVRKGIDPPYPTTGNAEDFYRQKLFQEMESGVKINLLILYNLNSQLQYDGKLSILRPVKLIKKMKKVTWDWRRTVTPSEFSVMKPVAPEYMHATDLPMEHDTQAGHEEVKEKTAGTGTGDK